MRLKQGAIAFGILFAIILALCVVRASIVEANKRKVLEDWTPSIVYSDTPEELTSEEQTTTRNETTAETSTSAKIEPQTFFPLTDDQRYLIERVVMAEAGSEPGAGIVAVANCLYNAMLRCEGDPYAAVIEYGYTNNRKSPSRAVRDAVQAVFDRGELLFDDDVLYFCRSDSENAKTGWHSTLELVTTIGNHNFYRVP